ncbi:unnamed protein product [Prorocentrum cordatum]|uniref:Uncharacterized protein n=1 Tax=Prorocentrum cordatum TaxID=2364126 RepID=A0ABN9VZH0_9DINO|nr:unnamed protein product [Polarella glacialis]
MNCDSRSERSNAVYAAPARWLRATASGCSGEGLVFPAWAACFLICSPAPPRENEPEHRMCLGQRACVERPAPPPSLLFARPRSNVGRTPFNSSSSSSSSFPPVLLYL